MERERGGWIEERNGGRERSERYDDGELFKEAKEEMRSTVPESLVPYSHHYCRQ